MKTWRIETEGRVREAYLVKADSIVQAIGLFNSGNVSHAVLSEVEDVEIINVVNVEEAE